jgi:magnesium chelatase family protein
MSLAIVYTRASSGIDAPLVTVEVHLSKGMVGFSLVGLPETAVKESKERVRSAVLQMIGDFPGKRITVNLAPADVPKEGARFDLAIAIGILAAAGLLPLQALEGYEILGELALSGELRAVHGVLPAVLQAKTAGRRLMVPTANAHEAALVEGVEVFHAAHLQTVCAHLRGESTLPLCLREPGVITEGDALDMADVKGQPQAKRALEVAAAGQHSLLLMGPPGTGKTMLASRLPGLLPPLDDQAALEVAAIASVSGQGLDLSAWRRLPFRAPHHTCSNVAIVGGGRPPRPGEISLAHHGVLFLDELPEFGRHVLESLREPLESGHITISRAACSAVFPARFQLIAAMNPCPCGYATATHRACRCSPDQVTRYQSKISGPLLDRLDMHVEVGQLPPALLQQAADAPQETSACVKARVAAARSRQYQRQAKANAELTVPELEQHAGLTPGASALLLRVMDQFKLSARAYHRIVKLGRTLADLANTDHLTEAHIAEAIAYRCLDKKTGFC